MKHYNLETEKLLDEFNSDSVNGLSSQGVKRNLEKYGLNQLEEKKAKSFLSKLKDQLKDFLVLILIVASLVSFYVGEKPDAVIILAIVIINAFLGIYQEGKAEKALDALKQMAAPESKVLRDGQLTKLASSQLVPGDIVIIEAGDIVPADLRLIETSNLKIDESSLTGESVAVEKNSRLIEEEDIALGDRHNMAFMNSIVTYGRAKAIVVGTGHNTEMGKIATMIQSYDDETTPLQQKLDQLGKYLGLGCILVCVLVFAIGIFRGEAPLEMFMIAISLAVAAIPEGLPAIVTVVLALGMSKMVKRNAIVKKLLAVETLGCTTVICSDKTGTLTQNEMTVVEAYTNDKLFKVSGTGYGPVGEFKSAADQWDIENFANKTFIAINGLCNDSNLTFTDGEYRILGDPTEGALVVLAEKAGFKKKDLEGSFPRVDEIPFDSDRKMMTTVHKDYLPNKLASFTKGAPDIILERCNKILLNDQILPLDQDMRDKIEAINIDLSKKALRVLAFSMKMNEEGYNIDGLEDNMIFVGLVGMIDPPREEAKEAIKKCHQAGIKTVMITGDYKETAFAIAKNLGIAEDESQAIMGRELDGLSDNELQKLVEEKRVYARVSPEHKVKIIDALKKNGEIAAMTGDGVNDALALKKADIGIAMGITGTDVAKNTADVILTDDNFASIVSAVEEGRIIYNNIKKFVFFLLSCNIGEIFIIFFSILFKMPVPLIPIQLLWLNLITDSFPALALGVEKGHGNVMDEDPRDPKALILDRKTTVAILVQSTSIAVAALLAYRWGLGTYNPNNTPEGLLIARTITFATVILAELLRAFSSRSEKHSIFEIGLFSNKSLNLAVLVSFVLLIGVIYLPFLQPIFKTYPLGLGDWARIVGFALLPLVTGEVYKKIGR